MAFVIVANTVKPSKKFLVNDHRGANTSTQSLLAQGHDGECYRYFGGKTYLQRRF